MYSQAPSSTKQRLFMRLLRVVSFVASIGLLPVIVIYLPSGVYSSSRSGQKDALTRVKTLKIKNSTHSLEVSEVRRNGQEVQLSLRNTSEKDIAAFKISTASYGVTLDFTPDLFEAGTLHVQSLIIPNTNNAEDEVAVVAILFDDQTGEGNPNVVRQMTERRRGEKLQLLTIFPVIDRLLMAPKGQLSESLDAAEKATMELPDSLDRTDSFEFRAGLQDAKEKILADLKTVKALQKNPDALVIDRQLRYFHDHYANKLSKLPD